jgi:HD-GYP domain-containing protein (c-di-GMP phosphodiesterase class II)
MAHYIYEDDDTDILGDFANDFQDLYENAETLILQLEHDAENDELLNALFRAIHTVKGNCGLLGIHPLVDILQGAESVLDLIRQHQLEFQPMIGDLTLLVMDRCSSFIVELERDRSVYYDGNLLQAVAEQLNKTISVSAKQRVGVLTKALALLDPTTTQVQEQAIGEELLKQYDIQATDDLLFILNLAEQTQSRAAFWQGRIERIIGWLMALNEYVGQPVDREQLFVAVCMHDIGMAMLPSELINKYESLRDDELKTIQDHVWVASRLISSFPNWHEAKRIIDHHQENHNGTGYPLGLTGNDICTGAQMLAIVHAFEAITHGYSKTLSRKRPLMRAVMELNRFSGEQFNPKLVTAFMEVTRVEPNS